MTPAPFPQLKIGSEGGMTVVSAPDIASFPLAWLTAPARAKGLITCKKNRVTFSPTEGEPVEYLITSYDYESKRFLGEKV